MKRNPELNLIQKSIVNTLAFIATAVVFLLGFVLSPLLVFFYVVYNILSNLKNKGNAAADKWAAGETISFPHAKVL